MNKKLTLLVVVILAIAGVIALIYFTSPERKLITKIGVNLTPELRQRFEENIQKEKAKIESGNKGDESDFMRAYLSMGINYESLGELGLAREAYLNASKERPQSSIPWSNLGSLYQQMGGDELAKEALEKALELELALVVNWQKWIEFNQYKLKADDQKIRELYLQAFQATNHNLTLHRDYARYLENMGDLASALEEWMFIATQDVSDENARKEASRLRNQLESVQ